MSDFYLIFNFILSQIRSVWGMYSTNLILGSVIALFIMGKVINIIRRVLPHG